MLHMFGGSMCMCKFLTCTFSQSHTQAVTCTDTCSQHAHMCLLRTPAQAPSKSCVAPSESEIRAAKPSLWSATSSEAGHNLIGGRQSRFFREHSRFAQCFFFEKKN